MSKIPHEPTSAQDEGRSQKYFVSLPNSIDDMGLDPFAFRLYAHIKRRAGDDGACWESTRNLAECCQMSTGRISQAKKTLEDHNLITIKTIPVKGGQAHYITIVDIWPQNMAQYSKRSLDEPLESSPDERKNAPSVHPVNANPLKRSPDETKKNHNKEKPIKEEKPIIAANAAEKPKRQPTGKNAIKEKLSLHFSEKSTIPIPPLETKAQGKAAGTQWFNPLLAIYAACNDNLETAKDVIQEAIECMDTRGLTFSNPQSIEKAAIGIACKRKRDQEEKDKRAATAHQYQAQSEAIQAQRKAKEESIHPHLKQALDTWKGACEFLAVALPQQTYALYIKPLEVLKPNGTFRLKAPDDNICEWLDKRLRRRVEDALYSAVGRDVVVEFIT